MTIQELKKKAKELKSKQNYAQALDFYLKIWKQQRAEWNGYFLAQCYRKKKCYKEAKEMHLYYKKHYPNFSPMKDEECWLFYSEKIKDWDNPDLISDGEKLLSRTNQYDKYTGNIYCKTVIRIAKHLLYKRNYQEALSWLKKLDQSVISNSVYSYDEIVYPADRKVYFILFAETLIGLKTHPKYIENCLECLKINKKKKIRFKANILNSITYGDYVSRVKLALFLKTFEEERHIREKRDYKKIYNSQKVNLISDLSHYLFCPVSYAIKETYNTKVDTNWEKDEWLGKKQLFIDRYNTFKKTNSIDKTFPTGDMNITPNLRKDFNFLLNSEILVNNTSSSKLSIYSNPQNTLRGAPDYILKHPKGYKYALTEKFSGINSSDKGRPFESDLIKHYAFLEELKCLNLHFGFFLTWYWTLKDISHIGLVQKKLVVSSYRLIRVERNYDNTKKLKVAIRDMNRLKNYKSIDVNGNKISYANKCLNCSVFSFCNHKTGRFDKIELPYNIDDLKLGAKPDVMMP